MLLHQVARMSLPSKLRLALHAPTPGWHVLKLLLSHVAARFASSMLSHVCALLQTVKSTLSTSQQQKHGTSRLRWQPARLQLQAQVLQQPKEPRAQVKRECCALQVAGMALEALKQPVINGYFIAGSLVGPGGAGLIKVAACFWATPWQK